MTILQSIARGCCFSPGLLLIRLLPASLSSAIRIPPRHPILASRRLCQNRWLSGASGKKPVYPPLDESVIREQFVSGSGPGGQKINKTQNKVVLTHLPSGTVVHCQETRSLHENRRIARERLQEKLDVLVNGDHAVSVVAARERRARDRHEHNRSVARLQLKLQLKADLKAEQKQLLAPAGRGGHEDSGGGRGDASGGSDAR